ncbi:MAG: hypothetical protein HZC43_05930 [Nitrosomonadales bacterium]|nr:hypothetical protein [Nitrosomonadales bacterium]
MKLLVFLAGIFFSAPVLADPPPPAIIPPNQQLAAISYFKDGKQSGCGIRVDGETGDKVWINVLLSVFMRQSGSLFGMFKVITRKIIMVDGAPLMKDGRVVYSSAGNIRRAWIKTGSGVQFLPGKGGGPHNDGYMAPVEFDNAMDLLIAMPQSDFRVGISKSEGGAEEVFEFNRRITQDEAGKLSSCMKNLREAREGKSF